MAGHHGRPCCVRAAKTHQRPFTSYFLAGLTSLFRSALMSFTRISAAAVLALTLSAAPALARQAVTQTDITRLQDGVSGAYGDLGDLRARDAGAARSLQADLDDLREEAIYLKVKLRKEGSVPRAEYLDLRDRLDDLRARATSTAARGGTRGDAGMPLPLPP